MKILFVSTHNFATNPRLVKEIDLAIKNMYEVCVLCCSFDNWSKKNNEIIKRRWINQIEYYEVPGNRKPFFPWLLSSFWFFASNILLRFFPGNRFLLSLYSNKRSFLLLRKINKMRVHVDMVVAHNPGSFYPAMKFAKKNKVPFGIDLEDFHPGETNNKRKSEAITRLLKATLHKANYITVASPLILGQIEKIMGRSYLECKIILNYFPKSEFFRPAEINSKNIRFVWFSQNIAKGRGLEEIISAIKNRSDFELHLYGNTDPVFYKMWIEGIENIYTYKPLPQDELHKRLSIYDVGLAIENSDSNFNRDLCLTNKLLAYFQAGLFIIATETSAQKDFIEQHQEHGLLTPLSLEGFNSVFTNLSKNKECIRTTAKSRFENAQRESWEGESEKLLNIWKLFLN